MSTINQKILVKCPLAQADTRLRAFFREHGNPEGNTARIELQVHEMKRTVIATICLHTYPADMTPRYRMQWETVSYSGVISSAAFI